VFFRTFYEQINLINNFFIDLSKENVRKNLCKKKIAQMDFLKKQHINLYASESLTSFFNFSIYDTSKDPISLVSTCFVLFYISEDVDLKVIN